MALKTPVKALYGALHFPSVAVRLCWSFSVRPDPVVKVIIKFKIVETVLKGFVVFPFGQVCKLVNKHKIVKHRHSALFQKPIGKTDQCLMVPDVMCIPVCPLQISGLFGLPVKIYAFQNKIALNRFIV